MFRLLNSMRSSAPVHAPELIYEGVDGYFPLDPAKVPNLPPYIAKRYYEYGITRVSLPEPNFTKKLAVVIPYRKREDHLRQMAPALRAFISEQLSQPFQIYVINQVDELRFNGGALRNIGFEIAKSGIDYVAFHDVDHIPRRACYGYLPAPAGLVWRGYPKGYFSAATLYPVALFESLNGYCNNYWQWGWEDDDLRDRCLLAGVTPFYYRDECYYRLEHPPSITRTADGRYLNRGRTYRSAKKQKHVNRAYYREMVTGKRDAFADGLSTLQYEIKDRHEHEDYIMVDVSLERLAAASKQYR